MKRHLLPVFFSLLLVLTLKGQNFQTVYPDMISSFLDENNNVNFIRIDSTSYEDGLILYPFSVNQFLFDNCFSPLAGSWIGTKIIILDNGYNVFINHEQDSIKINTLALEGDSWIAYGQPGQMHIVAKVVHQGETEFLGLTDAVKVIGFEAFDAEGEPLDTEANTMQVKISENHGLIQTLNFYHFPETNSFFDSPTELTIAGISNPETGVQNFTWVDVYDFQPGDVLHVLEKDGTWIGQTDGYFQITETRKVIQYLDRTDYNDSISFVYRIKKRTEELWTGNITLLEDTLTMTIEHNSALDHLPGEPVFQPDYHGNETSYIVSGFKQGQHLKKTFVSEWYVFDSEDCWSWEHYDGLPQTWYYMKGLGGPYYPYQALFGGMEQKELVYYEKNGVTWGTPLDVTHVQDITAVGLSRVYPNPARDEFTIHINAAASGDFSLRLYDTGNRLIQSTPLQRGDNQIGTTHLKPGLYFIIIPHNSGLTETHKIQIL